MLGYLVLAVPVRGWRTYHRLLAQPDVGPERRRRNYRRTVLLQSGLALLTGAILVLSPDLQAEHLGLVLPHGPYVGAAVGLSAVFIGLLVLPLLWFVPRAAVGRTSPAGALLPRAPGELPWAAAFALAAGIGEELLMRGLLFAAALSIGWSVAAVLWWGAVVFGLQHVYQGAGAVVFTAILGGLFGWLYLVTGSLLIPMVVHVLIDLRALVLVPFLQIRSRRAVPGPDLT